MAKKRNNECADRQSLAAFAPRQHAAHPPTSDLRPAGRKSRRGRASLLSLWRNLSSCKAWAKIWAARAHATLARGARWENLHERPLGLLKGGRPRSSSEADVRAP